MAERLGEVVYWLGSVLAVCAGAGAVWLFVAITATPDRYAISGATLALAVAIWAAGRGVRYVLAGR